MKKKLICAGNSWQLYINKPFAQLLGITPDEYSVKFEIENKILYIKKFNNNEIKNNTTSLIKKLIKRANSYGLNIPIPILEMLEVNPEKDLIEYEINGQTLTIRRAD